MASCPRDHGIEPPGGLGHRSGRRLPLRRGLVTLGGAVGKRLGHVLEAGDGGLEGGGGIGEGWRGGSVWHVSCPST